MFSAIFGTNPLDDLIDKATSENLPSNQEDIALNLEICDQIRSKTFNPKDVINSLRRRLRHTNPNVQLLALSLTDTCVKNGGNHFLVEVASRVFMDDLVSIIKHPGGINIQVKNRILECIQSWSISFKDRPELAYTSQVYGALKAQGYTFPPMEAMSSAMIDTKTAPEWTDSDVCMRCRTAFTFTNRKHHCRNCGQTFCQACSSNNVPLPHFGITDSVRVCTGCYLGIKKISHESASISLSEFISTENPPVIKDNFNPATSNAYGDMNSNDFDADLKKAIELSLKEAANNGASNTNESIYPTFSNSKQKEPAKTSEEQEDDPDLAAAIAASLKDLEIQKKIEGYNRVSNKQEESMYPEKISTFRSELPWFNLSDKEIQNLTLFPKLIESMNRYGQVADPSIHALYVELSGLKDKLELSIKDSNDKHSNFVELQSKLNNAVKLYDSLLEKSLYKNPYLLGSVSNPTTPNPYSSLSYGPYPSIHETSSNHVNYESYHPDGPSMAHPNAPSAQPNYAPPNEYSYNQPTNLASPTYASPHPPPQHAYEPNPTLNQGYNAAPTPGAPSQYLPSTPGLHPTQPYSTYGYTTSHGGAPHQSITDPNYPIQYQSPLPYAHPTQPQSQPHPSVANSQVLPTQQHYQHHPQSHFQGSNSNSAPAQTQVPEAPLIEL